MNYDELKVFALQQAIFVLTQNGTSAGRSEEVLNLSEKFLDFLTKNRRPQPTLKD